MNKPMSVWDRGFHCEVRGSDSNCCCAGIHEMLDYMKEQGAENIFYDDEFGVWRCSDPEWIASRKRWSEFVQRQCMLYGCE